MATGSAKKRSLALDGGLATEIERMGYNLQGDPLWSARFLADNPSVIRDVHKSYVLCGSDVIITASYQASIPGFCEHLKISPNESESLIKLSVKLAHQAIEESNLSEERSRPIEIGIGLRRLPLVAGSVGPYGACLHDGSEYTGTYVNSVTKEMLQAWHRPRIKALLEAGVDLLACETLPAQLEARAILELLRNDFPHARCWITFSCKDELCLCHGEKLSDAVSSLIDFPQAIGFGINCTAPIYVKSLLDEIRPLVEKKGKTLVVYPNSGEKWTKEGWQSAESIVSLEALVPSWISSGAEWIGGCCRTEPKDIRIIKTLL
ncbi:homocysteine S-methyltransferase YbgG-like isoform X2 [Oscarella lobularis]|uniref:homocysteine S-methyltransferase YbgG-like isoform X2 n=1 Tax=Oscarella lobularis TaxID=121494 RepID=UPI003313BC8A